MDIYSAPGTKVKFNDFHGSNFDRNYIKSIGVKKDDILTVVNTVVHDWSTDVYFEEIEGAFNSCCFDDLNVRLIN